MFKKNEGYKQGDLFSVDEKLRSKQSKLWKNSREHKFYFEVFQKIDEDLFSCL